MRIYLFKRILIDKTNTAPIELLIKLGLGLDKDFDKDKNPRSGFADQGNRFADKDLLINNMKVFTVNDEREQILGAIILYNDLSEN